jgi:hypothetical protein
LVFSKVIDQQPVEDDDDTVVPIAAHGPPTPTAGLNVLDAETTGGDAAGAVVIGEEALDPATSGMGLGTGLTGSGLSPELVVSTEPNGIPAGEAPPSDGVAIADDEAVPVVELVPQLAELAVLPGNGIPIAIPPPSKVVPELEIPDDAVAWTGHATPLPMVPGAPVGSGLRPGDGSSVAPMAFPVGGTVVAPVIPGGEVMPTPETVSFICAATGPQPNAIVRIDAISARRIVADTVMKRRSSLNCGAGFIASASR